MRRRSISARTSPRAHPRGEGARQAFTLVELLVVLGIIGLLAALITPVTIRALAKSRNAAIKAEIDMLHMAIMNYKNEYGSFPPCLDFGFNPNGPASKHLARLFPRCPNPTGSGPNAQFNPDPNKALTPFTAIVSWLGGYTDDPSSPLLPLANRKRLYDFDQSRITGLQYHPAKKPGSPYLYYDASSYSISPYFSHDIDGDPDLGTPGAQRIPVSPPPTRTAADFGTVNPPPANPQPFFNPDTFQILCAGADEQFGTADDLSNFWPGTRQEYLDSLQ
jgi:prepilin-type N-terminal cleavage/methylation domain-containing protein